MVCLWTLFRPPLRVHAEGVWTYNDCSTPGHLPFY